MNQKDYNERRCQQLNGRVFNRLINTFNGLTEDLENGLSEIKAATSISTDVCSLEVSMGGYAPPQYPCKLGRTYTIEHSGDVVCAPLFDFIVDVKAERIYVGYFFYRSEERDFTISANECTGKFPMYIHKWIQKYNAKKNVLGREIVILLVLEQYLQNPAPHSFNHCEKVYSLI